MVLGGERRLYGAFIGVLIYTVIEHYASEKDPFYWQFFIGLLLMVLVLFFEGGLMGIIDRFMPGRAKSKTEGGAK